MTNNDDDDDEEALLTIKDDDDTDWTIGECLIARICSLFSFLSKYKLSSLLVSVPRV